MNLWYLIFIKLFLLYKIESGKIQPNFDVIFGDGWDKNESEEKVIKIEQNDQNEQNNNSAFDQMGEEMGNVPNDQQKTEIIQKFDKIKGKLKEKGKYHWKNDTKIERKIGKLLGTNREKIYKWKKELNLNKRLRATFYDQKKNEFIERIDEFKSLYGQGKQKGFVKELGISEFTFLKWKKEFVPNYKKRHSNEEKLEKMKQYFEFKERNPKISDERISKNLGIGIRTLMRWKKKFA